ncbi:GFA family protein [Hyphomonas sp.]|uniref:GFA family protein n=1 Tax=Hyphomonas sp. TaxID=87 RepID=UPI0025BA3209|nr:GFA family protein [Hyphomonas sp.]MBI1399954.1 aldehyde-activating protein [Hyphomonas sp.]
MVARLASCRCGQLTVTCEGEPVRVSVCHCLNCQRRSGSAFAVQARWPDAQVSVSGTFKEWTAISDSGNRATFHFCPDCGSTLWYTAEAMPGLTALAVGAFADPAFPSPEYSVYEGRKHAWVAILGEGIDHFV